MKKQILSILLTLILLLSLVACDEDTLAFLNSTTGTGETGTEGTGELGTGETGTDESGSNKQEDADGNGPDLFKPLLPEGIEGSAAEDKPNEPENTVENNTDAPKDTSEDTNKPDGTAENVGKEDPPQYDFGGAEIRIYNTKNFDTNHFELLCDENGSDYIGRSYYERNQMIESTYQVSLLEISDFPATSHDYDSITTHARIQLNADVEFDIYLLPAPINAALALEGHMQNLAELSEIDLEQDGWYQSYNDGMTVNDRLYTAMGSFSLAPFEQIQMLAYNGDLLTSLGLLDDPDAISQMAIEGLWTLEKFNELVYNAAQTNADGSVAWNPNGTYCTDIPT